MAAARAHRKTCSRAVSAMRARSVSIDPSPGRGGPDAESDDPFNIAGCPAHLFIRRLRRDTAAGGIRYVRSGGARGTALTQSLKLNTARVTGRLSRKGLASASTPGQARAFCIYTPSAGTSHAQDLSPRRRL